MCLLLVCETRSLNLVRTVLQYYLVLLQSRFLSKLAEARRHQHARAKIREVAVHTERPPQAEWSRHTSTLWKCSVRLFRWYGRTPLFLSPALRFSVCYSVFRRSRHCSLRIQCIGNPLVVTKKQIWYVICYKLVLQACLSCQGEW